MVPGAAVAAALSTGDVSVGAIGTVAYRDGDRIWAFGHGFDSLGRRSLFLQDSYVYGIIQNPLGIPDVATTYKLASGAGHPLGSFTSDTDGSVAGSLGALPDSVGLRVVAERRGGDAPVVLDSQLADERPLGFGAGLALLAPLTANQALERLRHNNGPVSFSLCTSFRVRELRRPFGYCNPYFDTDSALFDLTEASSEVDGFDLAPMHLERVRVSMKDVRNEVAEDVLVGADGPRRAHPGERIHVRLTLQRRRGARRTLSVPVRLPRSLRPGPHRLVIAGNGGASTSPDELITDLVDVIVEVLIFDDEGSADEPRSVRGLADDVRSFHRPLGVVAGVKGAGGLRLVYRSSDVSFEGRVRLPLRITRAARR